MQENKLLRTSCEFSIFPLDLYSKQVTLIQSLFYYMAAGGNLQRLKSAEMKNHFYSNIHREKLKETSHKGEFEMLGY